MIDGILEEHEVNLLIMRSWLVNGVLVCDETGSVETHTWRDDLLERGFLFNISFAKGFYSDGMQGDLRGNIGLAPVNIERIFGPAYRAGLLPLDAEKLAAIETADLDWPLLVVNLGSDDEEQAHFVVVDGLHRAAYALQHRIAHELPGFVISRANTQHLILAEWPLGADRGASAVAGLIEEAKSLTLAGDAVMVVASAGGTFSIN